jgi:hypothetical protein
MFVIRRDGWMDQAGYSHSFHNANQTGPGEHDFAGGTGGEAEEEHRHRPLRLRQQRA